MNNKKYLLILILPIFIILSLILFHTKKAFAVGTLYKNPAMDALCQPVPGNPPPGGPIGPTAEGQPLCDGYFTGQPLKSIVGEPGGDFPWPAWPSGAYTDNNGQYNNWVFPSVVDNGQANPTGWFIWTVYVALYQDPSTYNGRRWVNGASWLIETMLGRPGTYDFYGCNPSNNLICGIAQARSDFNNWASLVTTLANAGQVNWDVGVNWNNHVNTTAGGCDGYNNPSGLCQDIVAYVEPGFNPAEDIDFWTYDQNGVRQDFYINRLCLNGEGNLTLTQPQPPTVSCGNVNPASTEAGSNFAVTVNINYTSGQGYGPPSPPNNPMSLNITGSNGTSGSLFSNGNVGYTATSSSASFTTPTFNVPNASTYTVSWVVSGPTYAISCSGTLLVTSHPYLRVYGGDVLAGSGFGSSCAPTSNAQILGFNEGGTGGSGAGTQFATQSTSVIDQFSSASLRTSLPQPTGGLSFANSGGGYGGNFGSGICAQNYYANSANAVDPINPTPEPGGASYGNASIGNGQHPVLRYNGKLEINGNISYANPNTWGSISDIPSIYVIVQGNIYIDSNVTNLDGVYVAQPLPSDPNATTSGRIYTCTNPGINFVPPASLATTCNTKLTINGAFIADQVRFLRTNGSLLQSSSGEASTSSNIAEVFNYDPELWLVNPHLSNTPSNSYNSITSLPPVL